MPLLRRAGWPVGLALLGGVLLVVAGPVLTRPFWYDEQWRAFHVSLGIAQWGALADANAPMSAGWLGLEQVFGAVFGLHEWALRLPAAIALVALGPSTHLLGRWWLSARAAAAAAVMTTVNGGLLLYGLQLKSYLVEAAITPLLVHTWLCARRAREQGRWVWPAYLGLGGLCLVSQPGVFVLAPLLLIDLAVLLRVRKIRLLTWPVVAGAVALAQLATVTRRQSYLTHDNYWQGQWIHGLRQSLGQVWGYAADFGVAGQTAPDDNPTTPFAGSPLIAHPPLVLHLLVGLVVATLLVAGAAGARSLAPDRVVVIVAGGALVAITIAAVADIWPAGAVRVNLFLVPLLALVATSGATRLWSARPSRRWPTSALAVGRLATIALAITLVAVGVRWAVVDRQQVGKPILLGAVKAQLLQERQLARPGDVAILLTGRAEVDQWTKGMRFYSGRYPWGSPGYDIPASATLTGDSWTPGQATRWLSSRTPTHVFVSTYDMVFPYESGHLDKELQADGWCRSSRFVAPMTGVWTELKRCPRPRPHSVAETHDLIAKAQTLITARPGDEVKG